MRVLIAEDHRLSADSVVAELERHRHEVVVERDPVRAARIVADGEVDVAVVDLVFDHVVRSRARNGVPSTWTDVPWIDSGLLVLATARAARRRPGVVLWTAADEIRQLHLTYAREQLDVRVFCSKEAGVAELPRAVTSAAAGTSWVDADLQPRMPITTGSARLERTLLSSDLRRKVWTALALGIASERAVARLIQYSNATVNKEFSEMAAALLAFDPGQPPDTKRQVLLSSFAARHRYFFLDSVVRDSGHDRP